jgi:phosphotransferase system  glucose/maltose/N-acetylglucosamine-specific IIC component
LLQIVAIAPVTENPTTESSTLQDPEANTPSSIPVYVWAILAIALFGMLSALVVALYVTLKRNKKKKPAP